MSTLVPVLYACVRIMRADPACTDIPNTGTNVVYRTCVREDFAEYELRTRLQSRLTAQECIDKVTAQGGGKCQASTKGDYWFASPIDGNWICKPLIEFEEKP